MVEGMLSDFDCAYVLKSICLRYFNAAEADPDGHLDERYAPETHPNPSCSPSRRRAVACHHRFLIICSVCETEQIANVVKDGE